MADKPKVKLASNGAYWQACYYDSLGRRRAKSLGSKSEIGRRQALVLCERLAIELTARPQRADVGRAPSIAEWIETFITLKPDLGERAKHSYRQAAGKFMAFAGTATRIDRITATVAAEWVTTLAAPRVVTVQGKRVERMPSPATIAHYSRHMRCILNEAVHQGVLTVNPFARIRTQPKKIERSWYYVSPELFGTILAACRNDGWRCFLSLQRFGGLRKGESLAVRWGMIDWRQRTLTLPESVTKTGQERLVPLAPALYELLMSCRSGHVETDFIVPTAEVDRRSDSNQHSRFRTVLKKAGVRPWEDLFQTLRRNAVQDLRDLLKDPWAVTAIAGHSEEVERKYYLGRVRQADMDRITGAAKDAELDLVIASWKSLPEQARAEILAVVRKHSAG
jgi:integrase